MHETEATAWLSGYSYRRSHVIAHATGASTNYQSRIIVKNGTSEGASTTYATNDTITINNKIRSDFGDINFTSDDGTTCQKYWMEILNTGKNATFWVKIAANLTSTDQTIYMYYGKSAQTTSSNIRLTGIWGDDFSNGSISDWQTISNTSYVKVNSTIKRDDSYSLKFSKPTGYTYAYTANFTTAQTQKSKHDILYLLYIY